MFWACGHLFSLLAGALVADLDRRLKTWLGRVDCEELRPHSGWWSLPSVTRVGKKQTGVFKPLEFEVFYFDHLNLVLMDPGLMT